MSGEKIGTGRMWLDLFRYTVMQHLEPYRGWVMRWIPRRHEKGKGIVHFLKGPAYTSLTGTVTHKQLTGSEYSVDWGIHDPQKVLLVGGGGIRSGIGASVRRARRYIRASCSAYLEPGSTNNPAILALQRAYVRT